jgi:proteasome-associated ATPase
MAKVEDELLTLLSENKNATYEDQKTALEKFLNISPQLSGHLCRIFLEQKHSLKSAMAETKDNEAKFREVVKKLSEPPWYPSDFLRFSTRHQKATVVASNRKIAVSIHPDVHKDVQNLKPGSEVFLNHEMNSIIAIGEDYLRSGEVGIFDRYDRGRMVLKGAADQEIVVDVAGALHGYELRSGELVLFDRESRIGYERIENGKGQQYVLEDTPDVTFDQIGGLDLVIGDLIDEIDLHQLHPELTQQHKLKRAKGIVLAGPPGCGKTLVAKAIANYLGNHSNGSRFMSIPPGSHRSMWFGQSESKVREIFRLAKELSLSEGLPVILFFDELDNLGSRSTDSVNVIDSRILDTFLACIDGIEEAGEILLLAATNRADLLDSALFRPGRFADRVFQIPRPNRVAAREIFEKYLTPDLPFYANGNGKNAADLAEEMIDSAISYVYSPQGEANLLATLTLRDGKKRAVRAPEFISGAMISNVVREAKRRSCLRAARGEAVGIHSGDLLEAIDLELDSICVRLKTTRQIHNILTELPLDVDVVKVEVHSKKTQPRTHQYLSSVH